MTKLWIIYFQVSHWIYSLIRIELGDTLDIVAYSPLLELTTSSCRAFFRRTVSEGKVYRACSRGSNNCTIDPVNRTNCKCCRFNKCLEVDPVNKFKYCILYLSCTNNSYMNHSLHKNRENTWLYYGSIPVIHKNFFMILYQTILYIQMKKTCFKHWTICSVD